MYVLDPDVCSSYVGIYYVKNSESGYLGYLLIKLFLETCPILRIWPIFCFFATTRRSSQALSVLFVRHKFIALPSFATYRPRRTALYMYSLRQLSTVRIGTHHDSDQMVLGLFQITQNTVQAGPELYIFESPYRWSETVFTGLFSDLEFMEMKICCSFMQLLNIFGH